jgi:hypothetical protein
MNFLQRLLCSLLIISNFCTAQEIVKLEKKHKDNEPLYNSLRLLCRNKKIFNFLKRKNKTISRTQLILPVLDIKKACETLENNNLNMIKLWLLNLKTINPESQKNAVENSYDFCYQICLDNVENAHKIVFESGARYYTPKTRLTTEEKDDFKRDLFINFHRPELLKFPNGSINAAEAQQFKGKKKEIFDKLYSKALTIQNIEEEINPESKNMLRPQFIAYQRKIVAKNPTQAELAKNYYNTAIKFSNLLTMFHYISIDKKVVLKKMDKNYFYLESRLALLAQLFEGEKFIHYDEDISTDKKYKDLSNKIKSLKIG